MQQCFVCETIIVPFNERILHANEPTDGFSRICRGYNSKEHSIAAVLDSDCCRSGSLARGGRQPVANRL
jgi:hypothetical protein